MKLSKINFFRLFLPFFLVSFILLSGQTFAQNDAEVENKDVLEYSDTQLIEQTQAEEDKDQSTPSKNEKSRFGTTGFGTDEIVFTRDFSLDVFYDNFFFGGFSFLLGADIYGLVTVGGRISFPLMGGFDTGWQFPDILGVLGGALQVEAAFSLINFFLPSFTTVDLEFFIRGGAVLGVTLSMNMWSKYEDNPSRVGVVINPINSAFSFYYKPTFVLGLNLLMIEKIYLYVGLDFGSYFGNRVRPPLPVSPVLGLAFKF